MKNPFEALAVLGAVLLFTSGCSRPAAHEPDYPIRAIPLTQVDITDEFWAPKQEVIRQVSLPYLVEKFEEAGRTVNANLVEAAAYMIMARPDPELEAYIDTRIHRMLQSVGSRRVSPTAAVAWYEATGKREMLDAALQAADEMVATYGPGKQAYISGHQGQKIGLIRLSRLTGDDRYWRLAQFFIDIRGQEEFRGQGAPEYPDDPTYHQNHAPVVEQDEAVGHCVRALYLYIPLTDIAALTGEPSYAAASERIWNDVVSHKMYLTGGIGSIRQQEKFGAAYELPNLSGWGEICAAYAQVVWNQRLFLLNGDAKFADTLERALYNGLLVGVSLTGDRFFYQSPLSSYGDYERWAWINYPGCPPNLTRLIAGLGSFIYAQSAAEPDLYVNLFVGSSARVEIDGIPVGIRQDTRYPWEGRVRISVDPERDADFTLAVRIPGWSRGEIVPSDLYEAVDPIPGTPSVLVNGEPIQYELRQGYARIQRRWTAGDAVELDLPMRVVRVRAHPNVRDNEGRIALTRGPLVYSAEWPDNDGAVMNIVLPESAEFSAEFRSDLLNGVTVVRGAVEKIVRGADGRSLEAVPHDLVAIPHYAWANRGMGEMAIWLAAREDKAWLEPVPPSPIAAVRSSGGLPKDMAPGYNDQSDRLSAVYDGYDPLHSADESYRYFRMRAPEGQPAWVEYEFEDLTEISSSEAYFVDDRRFCRKPQAWRILVRQGDRWVPVEVEGGYPVERDRFNKVTFPPVVTRAVRIEIEPQSIFYQAGAAGPPDAVTIREDVIWREVGLIEWRVR